MTHPQTQDDEALVEVMARAMVTQMRGVDFDEPDVGNDGVIYVRCYDGYLNVTDYATAALTALRNHEGRKG